MEKINKLTLPATILIASVILGGFYYVSQLSKQNRDLQTPQRAYNFPTATEVFRLRSECAIFGEKILNSNAIGSALTQSQVSHYNPETNRCYVQLTVQSTDLSGDYFINYLFDGQTRDLLASATKSKGKKDFGYIFSGPAKTGKSDSLESIFDTTNDYINEVMKDDWKK